MVIGWAGLASVEWSRLRIPLTCVVVAQAMQHFFSPTFGSAAGAASSMGPELLAFSFLKVLAVVVLAISFARLLVEQSSGWRARSRSGLSDNYLFYILALNAGCVGGIVLYMNFVNSDGFASLGEMGLTKPIAKGVLIGLVILLVTRLNKRVFKDLSFAIGSDAALRVASSRLARINKRFLSSLLKNCLKYFAPAYVVHVLLATVVLRSTNALTAVMALDSIVVVAVSLLTGYAIFISHEEALAEDVDFGISGAAGGGKQPSRF